MVLNASDVRPVSFMLMEAATAQLVPSLMELNVQLKRQTNVSVFQAPIGMELTVFASQDSQQQETHASVMVSSWEIIVKDVLQNLTLSSLTEFVNVIMDSYN